MLQKDPIILLLDLCGYFVGKNKNKNKKTKCKRKGEMHLVYSVTLCVCIRKAMRSLLNSRVYTLLRMKISALPSLNRVTHSFWILCCLYAACLVSCLVLSRLWHVAIIDFGCNKFF